MPLNRYVVRVDPQGQTVTVDILDTSGTSVVVYDSPQFAASSRTLPLVITSQTDFWLSTAGPYDVSCKVGGAEVAAAGAPKRVQVSDVPVLVVPDWERERTASPGGSTPGVECWFESIDSPAITSGGWVSPQWHAFTDGITGSVDVIVHVADPTAAEVVNGGKFLVTAQAQAGVADVDGYVTYYLKKNNDSVGPLYEITPRIPVTVAGPSGQDSITLPVTLVAGDLIRLVLRAAGGAGSATFDSAYLTFVRIG